MSVEIEVREYLESELKELATKARDIGLVLYYYGFSNTLWPTLEDAAIEFGVGDSEGRRAERPRQIINNKFRNNAKLSYFPSLTEFSSILTSSNVHSSAELLNECMKNGLIDEGGNLIALFRILHDLGEANNYNAYSLNLTELTRNLYSINKDFLIAEKESIRSLRKALKKSKTIPGLIGISKLAYLINRHEIGDVDQELLMSIIKKDPDSWFYNYQGDDYYLFESRDNTLVNSLEKIKNITESEDADVMTEALSNSLRRRTPPKGRDYPPKNVIKRYLLSSKYTKVNGNTVSLQVEQEKLTDVEQAITNYMRENDIDDYPTISSYLISLGYSKPLVDKVIFHSPLVHVDKSAGRYYYKYRLVGANNNTISETLSDYEVFRQRLLKTSSEGTDRNSEVVTRKEHYILSEWLFKGKEHEKCAICNKTYSVKSLVTAHKKRRADCAENERTDPYIVMPLCNFGCDYLYENGLIYINNGIVNPSDVVEGKYFDELSVISPLIGNSIDERWLKGSDKYFAKPNNRLNTEILACGQISS